MTLTQYLALCVQGVRRHWVKMLLPVAVILLLQVFIRLDVNYTDSLPHHVYLTLKGKDWQLKRGDYAAFAFPTENPVSPFRKGDHLVKVVVGVPGDVVRIDADGSVFILSKDDPAMAKLGGVPAGKAKPFSKSGKPLAWSQGGVIPDDHFYMFAPHQDSLDSRYAMVGLVERSNLLGKTIPIF